MISEKKLWLLGTAVASEGRKWLLWKQALLWQWEVKIQASAGAGTAVGSRDEWVVEIQAPAGAGTAMAVGSKDTGSWFLRHLKRECAFCGSGHYCGI